MLREQQRPFDAHGGPECQGDQEEVPRPEDHLRRRLRRATAIFVTRELAKQFTKDTGIEVKVVPLSVRPVLCAAREGVSSKSSDMDCGMIDVVWPGALAPHLVDLSRSSPSAEAAHFGTIIPNNTIEGSSSRCRGSATSGSSTTAPTC